MKKTGRNDDCPCGSGKKYKFCCGDTTLAPKKRLSRYGFERCFLKLVKDAGGELEVSVFDMEELPKDEALAIGHDADKDVFVFKVVKVKKSVIIQPDRRLITN